MENLMMQLMMRQMMQGQLSSVGNSSAPRIQIHAFHTEFQRAFPDDRQTYEFLEREHHNAECLVNSVLTHTYRATAVFYNFQDRQMIEAEEDPPRNAMKRWLAAHLLYKNAFDRFVRENRHSIGTVWIDRPMLDFSLQEGSIGGYLFSNTCRERVPFRLGETHVAIGFVDLISLLYCDLLPSSRRESEMEGESGEEFESSPFRYVGIEQDLHCVAKANLMVELLKNESVGVGSISEVWFSSGLSSAAQVAVFRCLEKLLSRESSLQQHLRCVYLKWKGVLRIKARRSRQMWKENIGVIGNIHVEALQNLTRKEDRLKYGRYLATGEFSVIKSQRMRFVNPTFYCLEKRTGQCCFTAFPMHVILKQAVAKDKERSRGGSVSLFTMARQHVRREVRRLKERIVSSQIEVEIHHGFVTSDNPALCNEIRSIPKLTSISWSNIPDFLAFADFHRLLRDVSPSNQVLHFIQSMNWGSRILGADFFDYPRDERLQMLQELDERRKLYDEAIQGQNRFLRRPILTVTRNILNAHLKRNVKDAFLSELVPDSVELVHLIGSDQGMFPPSIFAHNAEYLLVAFCLASEELCVTRRMAGFKKWRPCVCRKGNAHLRCGRCRRQFYCSRECQRLDWRSHRVDCES